MLWISVTSVANTVPGSAQGFGICCAEAPQGWMTQHTFKYGKEREEPQKHEWLQVEHSVDGVLEPCRMGTWDQQVWLKPAQPLAFLYAPGSHALTQLSLLQKDLCEGPANATDERGPQHQGEALHIELRGLVGEHEEASSNEQNHQDQCCTLGRRMGSSVANSGGSCGKTSSPWLLFHSPALPACSKTGHPQNPYF